MKSFRHLCFGFFLLVTATAPCFAQSTLKSDVDSAFAHALYERVELLVLRGAPQLKDLPSEEHVAIHLTTGYALIMLDRENEAREYFRRARH
jgi:hypothetical protein